MLRTLCNRDNEKKSRGNDWPTGEIIRIFPLKKLNKKIKGGNYGNKYEKNSH